MKPIPLPLVLAALFFTCSLPAAVALEGAAAVINSLAQTQTDDKGEAKDSAAARFSIDLKKFSAESSKMKPRAAAQGWMELVKKWAEAGPSRRDSDDGSEAADFDLLVRVVPAPPAWEELHKKASADPTGDSVRDQLLALFAATLVDDEAGKWKAFNSFREQISNASENSGSASLQALSQAMGGQNIKQWANSYVFQLAQAVAKVSDDPGHILGALNIQMEGMEKSERHSGRRINVPDLVTIAGTDKARAFLQAAMERGIQLEVEGAKTCLLAQTIALENIGKLKAPQWNLIKGIDATDMRLYEAMAKQFPDEMESDHSRNLYGDVRNGAWKSFPDEMESDHSRNTAAGYYLLSLIASGRTEEAKDLAIKQAKKGEKDLPHQGMNAMRAAGYGRQLYDFVHALLQQNPDLPLWSDYVTLAAENQKTAEAMELAKAASQRKNLTPAQHAIVLHQLSIAYLAHGSVDEALEVMRGRMTLLKAGKGQEASSDVLSLAVQMAELGNLLKRDQVRDEGIREALAILSKMEVTHGGTALLPLLMETGRPKDALEAVLLMMKPVLRQNGDRQYNVPDLKHELVQLAGIYDQAGRSEDVLIVLEQAPWWGAADLSEIAGTEDYRDIPLGVMAAKSLLAKGDKKKALDVLQATIRRAPSADSAYALLVELQGNEAMAFLDEQFARDRFQERPLIWKALLLLREKKLKEAGEIIRQAIAIDPSDGEMGRGDRMRAYVVLADILEAQGQPEDAKIYRGAVQAVRLSEEADKFQSAGLLSQAVTMYEKALTYFADAYCIQSRLAIQLAKLGDMEKAEEHFRRAFELMPDSFGRMESHCFGCEKVFKGELAETLAEKTFKKLLAENPKKPQIQYLLGYLRMEQERYAEALEHFQKAVELDPDYINAWKKILALASHTAIPSRQRDDATLALLRLDPFGNPNLRDVNDLKRLWTTVETLRKELPDQTIQPVLALDASGRLLAELRKNQGKFEGFNMSGQNDQPQLPPPGEILTQHELIQQTSQILTQFAQFGR